MTNIIEQLQLGSSDLQVRRFSDTNEADITDFNRYGNWTDDTEGPFIIPALLSYSDYSGSLVERSNYKAFEKAFDAGYNEWWTNAPGGHGTDCIVIDASIVPDDVADDVVSFLNGLQKYPLADENLHSKMEIEAQDKAWNNWVKGDFITAIERKFGMTFEDSPDDTKLFEVFNTCMDKSGYYWINESGGEMWCDVKRIAAKMTQAEFDSLVLTTISHEEAIRRCLKAEKQVESLKAAVIRKHEQLLETAATKEELTAILESFDISAIEWERIKAIGKWPNGREIRI
jgi:hypothetical protein